MQIDPLAKGTLVAGLEVSPVHSQGATEAQRQPQHHNRRHPSRGAITFA